MNNQFKSKLLDRKKVNIKILFIIIRFAKLTKKRCNYINIKIKDLTTNQLIQYHLFINHNLLKNRLNNYHSIKFINLQMIHWEKDHYINKNSQKNMKIYMNHFMALEFKLNELMDCHYNKNN